MCTWCECDAGYDQDGETRVTSVHVLFLDRSYLHCWEQQLRGTIEYHVVSGHTSPDVDAALASFCRPLVNEGHLCHRQGGNRRITQEAGLE